MRGEMDLLTRPWSFFIENGYSETSISQIVIPGFQIS